MPKTRRNRIIRRSLVGTAVLVVLCAVVIHHYFGPFPIQAGKRPDTPSPMAHWPWPKARTDSPHPGVTHWIDRSSSDRTIVELFDFDFGKNPGLRLELYDQDQDDRTPFDDKAEFWNRAAGQVTRHLNETGRGRVVAAWNGLFFQYSGSTAKHVAPVVLNGRPRYNVGTVRYAVGVKYLEGKPVFKVARLPAFKTLAEYDFASEGASCLILNGRPLRLQPFPRTGDDPFPPSKPPKAGESGFVRRVDHIRTSRTSMAWSKDNRHFYLLIVKEPDSEAASLSAFRHNLPLMGGWTVADEQLFWRQFGAWCAVNLDGGDVTQLAALRQDGKYDLVPARWGGGGMRKTFPPSFAGAPPGGSMMFFFVRDTRQ
jgi:hypothetical protein